VTSLLAAIAPGATVLIIARGLQGMTGALLVPSSLAMIIANFSGPDQGKAIGTWTAWTGISFILGPLLGVRAGRPGIVALGVRDQCAARSPRRWRCLARLPPTPPRAEESPVDLRAASLCAVGLGGIIYGLIEAPGHHWARPDSTFR
jgi:MFS family permease